MPQYQQYPQQDMQYMQQPGIPAGMPMDMPINHDRDFMQALFNFKEEVVAPLRHIWAGEEETDPGVWEKKPGSKPIMNQEGITRCCSVLASWVNAVYVVSNYDENAMNWTMRQSARGVINLVCHKYKDWEMEKINIPLVTMELISKIHALLLGARGDGFRRFFGTVHHIEETRQTQTQPQQSTGFGLFKKKQPMMFMPNGGY